MTDQKDVLAQGANASPDNYECSCQGDPNCPNPCGRTPAESERPPYEELRQTNVELMAKLREARDQVERLRGNGVWNGDWWCIRRDVYDAGSPNSSTVRQT